MVSMDENKPNNVFDGRVPSAATANASVLGVYDVLIIGAGPAGGSAAWHCAQNGLKTLVVEEHQAVGEPVHCGECLSQVACDRMGWKLQDEAIAMPVKGVRVIFPGDKTTRLTEEGYVLEKHKFEHGS